MSDGSGLAAIETYLSWNLGIVLCGVGFTGALAGVSTAQFAFYIRHYWRNDRLLLRTVVLAVWSLDILHLGFYSYTMYYYLVFLHNDFAGQFTLPWTSYGQTVTNTCLIAVVQVFYVMRVWSLSKYIIVTGALAIIVAADWALGILLTVETVITVSVSDLSTLTSYSLALSSVTASADILIAATLVILLASSRQTGSRSKRLIHRLIFYTINTGFLTSICALLSLITNVTMGSTNLYVLFYFISARLYTISMIASLNAREGLRNHMAEAPGITSIPHIVSSSDHERTGHGPPATPKRHATRSHRSVFGSLHRDGAVISSAPSGSGKPQRLDPDESNAIGLHTLSLPTR